MQVRRMVTTVHAYVRRAAMAEVKAGSSVTMAHMTHVATVTTTMPMRKCDRGTEKGSHNHSKAGSDADENGKLENTTQVEHVQYPWRRNYISILVFSGGCVKRLYSRRRQKRCPSACAWNRKPEATAFTHFASNSHRASMLFDDRFADCQS